jgi:ribosomal protein S12 methylthiotransferase
MEKKVHLVSLGCCKNLVDSEKILYAFAQDGWTMTDIPQEADAIIVNTCGFIDDAKQEAIDTLFALHAQKKDGALLVATGCLAQRYGEDLFSQMPELDLVVGIDHCSQIVGYVRDFKARALYCGAVDTQYHSGPRLYTGPQHYAYVRIADGCDNFCSYCAIPHIRGRYRSRAQDDILQEVRLLAGRGVREIILVAQDTTRYGMDTDACSLAELLHHTAQVPGVEWVRFLYAYPEMVTDELLDVMLSHENICNYVDIPIQHCCDDVLHRMNRRVTRVQLEALLEKLHAAPQKIAVRTTVMTGFPGETRAQHEELLAFLRKWRFDRLGAFAFSPQEGTGAFAMQDDVPQSEKQARLDEIMTQQKTISLAANQKRVGQTLRCVVDEVDSLRDMVILRSQYEAPEVDGTILLPTSEFEAEPVPGMTFDVRVTGALEYDLLGELQ